MKRILMVVLAFFFGASLGANAEEVPYNQKPLAEVKKEIQDGKAVVVDVREKAEWDEGHLKGAKLIPLPELVERLAEIPEDQEILLHCQGGGRASVAARSCLRVRRFESARFAARFA